MGGSGISREKFNARETILSSDFNRLASLTSRDIQNLLGDASTDNSGTPITGLSGPCSLTGIAATFNMTLAAAQALCWNPGDSSLTADDSAYEIARWPSTVVTFAAPNSNPRIDLVVATPAAVDTDSQSRNVLVDPVARTISPQNVYKTTNPQATIAVVTGTPGVTPAPPSIPAGAFPLFEVYVPNGATDATAFPQTPRIFRRAPFPWSNLSGIVSGFVPKWDLTADPSSTSSTISFGALDDCRVVIDGELIETFGVVLEIYQDAGSNNPFASAASAAWNKPYYLYAVGGRHAPQRGAVLGAPVVIVESLVAPFVSTGHPTSAITTPRGTTTQLGAVYIGLGSVVANSTRRAACFMDADMTYHANQVLADNVLQHAPTASNVYQAFDTHAPPVVPVISTEAAAAVLTSSGSDGFVTVTGDRGDGGGFAPAFASIGEIRTLNVGAFGTGIARGRVQFNAGGPKFWVNSLTGASIGTVTMAILGFDHQVKRLR